MLGAMRGLDSPVKLSRDPLSQLLADAFSCPVCQHWAHPVQIMPECGHVLCLPCSDAWLGRKRSCPVCRAPVHWEPGKDDSGMNQVGMIRYRHEHIQ